MVKHFVTNIKKLVQGHQLYLVSFNCIILEFIENMTSDGFENIRQFFETMPVMENSIEFQCQNCGKINYAFMNGYLDFFV